MILKIASKKLEAFLIVTEVTTSYKRITKLNFKIYFGVFFCWKTK